MCLQVFKRLHLGTVSFTSDTMDEVVDHLKTAYSQLQDTSADSAAAQSRSTAPKVDKIISLYSCLDLLKTCFNIFVAVSH